MYNIEAYLPKDYWKSRAEKAETERDRFANLSKMWEDGFHQETAKRALANVQRDRYEVELDTVRIELSTLRSKLAFTADGEPICRTCASTICQNCGELIMNSTREARDAALAKERN